jgi:hypothetical protein
VLAFRVGPAALQQWLPTPWQLHPMATGPSKDANLFVSFIDRLLIQDGEGKPIAGGTTQFVALGVSAKHGHTGETAPFVIRAFEANPEFVPGPYKTAVPATLRREAALRGTDREPGMGSEVWEMRENGGGVIEVRVEYQRGVPARLKPELKLHSAVAPSFFRLYRLDLGTDMVKSLPAGIDRVRSYHFRVTVPELRPLFDGTEQLVSIAMQPWVVQQAFLP